MPGGMNHHHMPRCSALHCTDWFIIRPNDIAFVWTRPMKSSEAAVRIDPPNSSTNVMNRYEYMFGAISRRMIAAVDSPDSLARSTNSRARKEKVWARTARATHGQENSPM